jgi:hypothetical protein
MVVSRPGTSTALAGIEPVLSTHRRLPCCISKPSTKCANVSNHVGHSSYQRRLMHRR